MPASSQPDWSQLPKPHPRLLATVVLPVRDEARRVASALLALARQRAAVCADAAPMDPACYEVIVLANNCRDGSAAIARRIAQRHPAMALHVVEAHFPAAIAHVGHARASLMDVACQRLAGSAGRRGIIASTDGDTQVAPDWLAATLAEFSRGADAVGGRIYTRSHPADAPRLRRLVRADSHYQRLRSRLAHLIDPDPHDPWPRHHQHFGASLAVSVAAYQRVGGCPAEPWLEDEALYRALRRHGLKVRHSPQVRVRTSGRRNGRVAVGLSQQLREWADVAEAAQDVQVADPGRWAQQLRCRRALRERWLGNAERGSLTEIAANLGLSPRRLQAAWQGAAHFAAFWMEVEDLLAAAACVNDGAAASASVTQQQAIRSLQALITQESKSSARPRASPAGRGGRSAAGSA